jgi:death-on-curing family protein
MKKVALREIEYLAFRYAKEFLAFNEPIPDFASRFPNKLESCLAVPFQTFAKKEFYRGLLAKAAILFYLMIKNHPFQNGNKWIAVTALFIFLYKNNKWLKIDNQELYNFAIWVAQSPASLKPEVVKAVEKFLVGHLVELKR